MTLLRHWPLLAALLALAFQAGPAAAAPEAFESVRPDGSTIYWWVDRLSKGQRSGLILLAQGSGCQSVRANANVALARSLFPGYAALTVEKYGVVPGDDPKEPFDANCPAAFHAHHTVSQRVADARQVIDQLRGQPWWNGQLVLFGGSEGGDVAALLAGPTRADAAILLSTGAGITFGEMVRQSLMDEMTRNHVPKTEWPDIDAAFTQARQSPDSTTLWGGSSLRFWADAIDRRVVDEMLRSDTAFLLIQGGRDASAPVGAARKAAELFAAAGRCSLTYWEFPAYGHGMASSDGASHMADVLAQSAAWLEHRLLVPPAPTACGDPL